jgi:hypothetical protein
MEGNNVSFNNVNTNQFNIPHNPHNPSYNQTPHAQEYRSLEKPQPFTFAQMSNKNVNFSPVQIVNMSFNGKVKNSINSNSVQSFNPLINFNKNVTYPTNNSQSFNFEVKPQQTHRNVQISFDNIKNVSFSTPGNVNLQQN